MFAEREHQVDSLMALSLAQPKQTRGPPDGDAVEDGLFRVHDDAGEVRLMTRKDEDLAVDGDDEAGAASRAGEETCAVRKAGCRLLQRAVLVAQSAQREWRFWWHGRR